jgi:mRNA-degrading endonuclease RelE of RelBE toxin-antitoxin system
MYRVAWSQEVIDKISKVYDGLNDDHRRQLLAAIESLDAQLLADPTNLGESRASPLTRVAIEGPLTIVFRIDDVRRVVRVSGVSYFQRNS